MKSVIRVETYDGVIHESIQHADRYLDKQYGNLLTKLTAAIIDLRLMKAMEYIDEHLEDFVQLYTIKKDRIPRKEEEQECPLSP
jgi:hypothetical protein